MLAISNINRWFKYHYKYGSYSGSFVTSMFVCILIVLLAPLSYYIILALGKTLSHPAHINIIYYLHNKEDIEHLSFILYIPMYFIQRKMLKKSDYLNVSSSFQGAIAGVLMTLTMFTICVLHRFINFQMEQIAFFTVLSLFVLTLAVSINSTNKLISHLRWCTLQMSMVLLLLISINGFVFAGALFLFISFPTFIYNHLYKNCDYMFYTDLSLLIYTLVSLLALI